MFRNISLILTISALTLGVPAFLAGSLYLDRPPPAHTGGFGEPTCQTVCHSEFPLNTDGGTLTMDGIPDFYKPGEKYIVRVMLTRPGTERAGFQMSARYQSGGSKGKQAGRLKAIDKNVEIDVKNRILYARHTVAGAEYVKADTARWSLEWSSPLAPQGPIIFYIAANAADWNDSETGDYIYTQEKQTKALQKRDLK